MHLELSPLSPASCEEANGSPCSSAPSAEEKETNSFLASVLAEALFCRRRVFELFFSCGNAS